MSRTYNYLFYMFLAPLPALSQLDNLADLLAERARLNGKID